MNDKHFKRGVELYGLEKWEAALQEFEMHLTQKPDDSHALSLAAFCELKLKRYGAATERAAQAITADPLDSHAHFVMSQVMRMRNAYPQAFAAIREALELEPFDPHYLTALADLHADQREWAQALEMADMALGEAPEDMGALNSRASALIKLGRTEEAQTALEIALRKNPEDVHTRANMGWLELERGRWNDAMEHFQLALQLNPESEWAREGLMHALRAKFPVYGLILRWFFFMNKYSESIQRQIMIAMYFGRALIDYLLDRYPGLAVIVGPLMVLWQIFGYLTWTIRAATTLFLRCTSYGRMLIRQEELTESNLVGGYWLVALLSWLYSYFIDPFHLPTKIAPFVFLSLPMVTSIYFDCADGPRRKVVAMVVGVMTVVGILGLVGLAGEFAWGISFLLFYFRALTPVLLLGQFFIDKRHEE